MADEIPTWLSAAELRTRDMVAHICFGSSPIEALLRQATADHGRVSDTNRAALLMAVDEIRRLKARVRELEVALG